MRYSQFQSDYPDIAGLLPQKFMANADDENTLRRAIEQDRTEYLDILDTLARKTPAKEIRKDPNRLTSKINFQSFYVEMKAYIALKHWVFTPYPADVQGTQGEPDYEFNIGKLDIEVASRTAWDKVDNVRVALEDKLDNTPYTALVTQKDDFIKIPYPVARSKSNRWTERLDLNPDSIGGVGQILERFLTEMAESTDR